MIKRKTTTKSVCKFQVDVWQMNHLVIWTTELICYLSFIEILTRKLISFRRSNFQKSSSKSCPELKFPFPGKGGGVRHQLSKPTSNILSPVLSWNFHFLGGEGVDTSFKVSNLSPIGLYGIWCCHLTCIWGELKDFDMNFLHSVWASASQIVSFGN